MSGCLFAVNGSQNTPSLLLLPHVAVLSFVQNQKVYKVLSLKLQKKKEKAINNCMATRKMPAQLTKPPVQTPKATLLVHHLTSVTSKIARTSMLTPMNRWTRERLRTVVELMNVMIKGEKVSGFISQLGGMLNTMDITR